MADIFLYEERPKVKCDISGQKFNRLSVLCLLGKAQRSGCTLWACRCDCGKVTFVPSGPLRSGAIKSCGCLRKQRCGENFTKHGATKGKVFDREYITWGSMKQRCKSGNSANRHLYRDKGIKVCERWLHGDGVKSGYECFLSDMGRKPTPKHSIERKDGNKDYEPSNCC